MPRWVLAGQKAPLTPEYQKVFDANLADMADGGQGNVPSWYCLPQGMPMMMNAYDPVEFVVTPDITYILISHVNNSYRRVYTDGRSWPKEIEPTFAGYSIGKWVDENGDGRFDTLEIETRSIKMPHAYDATGLPFHEDGEGVVKERIYLDKADANIIHDEITSIDHALTRPWTVTKTYRRDPKVKEPTWQLRGVRGGQFAGADRRGRLFHQSRRLSHAHQEKSGAARPALFQEDAEVARSDGADPRCRSAQVPANVRFELAATGAPEARPERCPFALHADEHGENRHRVPRPVLRPSCASSIASARASPLTKVRWPLAP